MSIRYRRFIARATLGFSLIFLPAVVLLLLWASGAPGAGPRPLAGAYAPVPGSIALAILIYFVAAATAYLAILRPCRTYAAEEAAAMKERELAVREANHRIKNNLHILSSLIDMGVEGGQGPEEIAADLKAKIRLIALVHEELYVMPRSGALSLRSYLERLAAMVMEASTRGKGIPCSVDGDDLEASGEACVSIGIMVTEFLLNAVKYARGQDCRILIATRRRDVDWTLSLESVGGVYPEGFDPHTSESFGMVLLRSYAEQLRGRFTFCRREEGAAFAFVFPCKRADGSRSALERLPSAG